MTTQQDYRDRITIESGKRGGKPCIRRMRITVYDILSWLAAGMSHAEIIDDFPELEEADILAALRFQPQFRPNYTYLSYLISKVSTHSM